MCSVFYPHIAIYAYIILRSGVEDSEKVITDDLIHLVRVKIGALAVPERFLVCCLLYTPYYIV